MGKETDPSLNERNFIIEALSQGLRVDGRGPHDIRNIRINLGPGLGHAEAQLGKTRWGEGVFTFEIEDVTQCS